MALARGLCSITYEGSVNAPSQIVPMAIKPAAIPLARAHPETSAMMVHIAGIAGATLGPATGGAVIWRTVAPLNKSRPGIEFTVHEGPSCALTGVQECVKIAAEFALLTLNKENGGPLTPRHFPT